ncbi:MAG: hypothetical protein ACK4YM_06590 [Novosphingobium sp.]
MFGFGPRITQVFSSRWKAVSWSLGILMLAYCTVPAADQAARHEPAGAAAAKASPHHSPWSKD